MAQYPCPQCSGKMFIEKMHEGYEVPCPHCGNKLRIPHGAAAEPQAPPSVTSSPPPLSRTSPDVVLGATSADVSGLDATSADATPALAGGLAVEPELVDEGVTTVPPQTGTPAAPVPHSAPRRHYSPPPRAAGRGQYDAMAFALGLAGFLLSCFPISAFGWYFGHQARAQARRAGREPDGLATAGWVLGIVGTVMWGGLTALMAIFFVVGIASGM